VITAIAENPQSGEEGALLAWRSQDGGRTWAASPQPITSVEGAAREGLHDTAGHPSGKVAVVWLDLRNAMKGGGTEVWLATSDDGGDTWGKERLLYRNEGGTVCECCHPSVAFDAEGNPVAMFRNALAGNRDMYLTGTDGGAKKLGRGTWPLEACPMDGGDIARGDDGWWTAWRRADTVYLARPGEDEVAVGKGEQPVVAHAAEGPHVVWTDGDRLRHRNPAGEIVTLAEHAAWPAAALLPDAVLVAYESGNAAAVRRVAVNPKQTRHGEQP
jgi:hypothetical protein